MEKSFHCLITLMAIASLALAAATNQDDSTKKKGMCTLLLVCTTYYYHDFFPILFLLSYQSTLAVL